MPTTNAWGASSPDSGIQAMEIDRRELLPQDVAISIAYCGVCHSDLHTVRNDWGVTRYPVVPGHEITGTVTGVGSAVQRVAVGDRVAVGTMIASCRQCDACQDGAEQQCRKGAVQTYGSVDPADGSTTQGGYSRAIVVRQDFVIRVPDSLDLARAAPLMCAGITTWSPLRHWNVGPGTRVGIIGLGGLGHMGVKLAKGLGAEVTMITTSPQKANDARALGADHVLLSNDKDAMTAAFRSFDFLLDTVPVPHDISRYLSLLDRNGTMCMVGAIDKQPEFHTALLMSGRKSLAGSGVGGIAETEGMLAFCAEKGILPECEMIGPSEIEAAFERMERADVKYRFVIDMAKP
jgi:uncharacterized zinc-type alcohol dehydrogenase-like protein